MVETRHQRAVAEQARRTPSSTKANVVNDIEKRKDEREKNAVAGRTSNLSIVACLVILAISYFTLPPSVQPGERPTVRHVWYFGWISALCTGLGVLPVLFSPNLHSYWIGVSNAIAAGMMVAASYSLLVEGCTFRDPEDRSDISSTTRTIIGVVFGIGFILITKSFLERHVNLTVGSLAGADSRKVLLIITVMTLHSLCEGVGIGVSFGGANGSELGVFISASIAVHNIPEGLAVAIVLLPRQVSKLTAVLWCIFTSIPQALMAVPAFWFVHHFIPIFPVGLGFAGGAMVWVAVLELLVGAYEDTNVITTGVCSSIAVVAMLVLQTFIDEGSRNQIV